MANKTVYPYGTGGSLPSSIGIINDLVTGGADKALAAQQGKVIGDYLFDDVITVDLSSITTHDWSLAAQNKWTKSGAKHKAVPVTAGSKILLSVASTDTTGGFYGFFTDYQVPSSANSPVYYVEGTDRVWLNVSSGTIGLIVPETATYLIICTKDGDLKSSTWTMKIVNHEREITDDFVQKSDIVDNLSSGGHDKVLSAEQGKLLAEKLSDGMPAGLTKYAYTGPLVRVSDTHYVARQKVSTITSIACQGGANYGDYLFMFTANNTTCWIYNLASSSLLQTITIPSGQRGFVSDCHCNTVNFGTEYYDANDPFPLIYVSTGNASGGYSGALVYRIVATTENDVTTYSLALVQTIRIPITSWSEFVVGDDGNCYVCDTSYRRIYRMKMPKLSDGDVDLDFENAFEVYRFSPQPASWDGSRNQNRMYHGGKIYMVSGVPASNEKSLFVVLDLATRTREVVIDLQTLGLNSEPETCFIWNGHFCVVFRSNANVYALYFE